MNDILEYRKKEELKLEERRLKRKGKKTDFSVLTKRIESGIKAAEAMGLPINKLNLDDNLLEKVKESGFDGVKEVLKNVDFEQAANTA